MRGAPPHSYGQAGAKSSHPARPRGSHTAAEYQPRPIPAPSGQSSTHKLALVGGVLAALVSACGMLLLRSTLQVRSIPERLMEWLLLFVPPGVFEAVLQRLGFDAKRYALDLAIALMLALLSWLGYAVLSREWSVRSLGLLGVGLWLAVMLVIMPLTSAGVFALDLLGGKRAAIGGYLAVGLTYAAVLALARTWPVGDGRTSHSRRTALAMLGAAGLSYVATYLAVRVLAHQQGVPTVLLEDPQEPIPSGGIDPPNAHPNLMEPSADSAPVQSTPVARAPAGLPEPTRARTFKRDKDGAVVTGPRAAGQLSRPITSNEDFYIVTKNAGGDPLIAPTDWRLLVDGEVARPFQLDYATLRRLPAVEVTKTLECISNFVGKPELAPFGAELISTATWKGVAVRDVLSLTGGPRPDAAWAVVFGADEFTSALPLEVIMDLGTLLVYEMNGEVLPHEHGYPVRLLLPDRYGMKNAKWLVGLRLLRREVNDWYGQRNWSKTALVQTMCRIDTPAPGALLEAGTHTVAGIAYAGTRGIRGVEYSVDAGETWESATLSEARAAGEDRWVAWRGAFEMAEGAELTIVARATDGRGTLQTEPFSLPEPDGGTGWPSIGVRTSGSG